MIDDDMISRLETIHNELRSVLVTIQLTFPPCGGKHNNESFDIPFVGKLTAHSKRDEMFVRVLTSRIFDIARLLNRPKDYITVKRIAAIRQRCFVLAHTNSFRTVVGYTPRARKNWDKKSAHFLAGKLLIGTFDKYITWTELNAKK